MTANDSAESRRLAALCRYEILDSPRLPEFDDITRLTALACGTPIALITLVAEARQWFLSHHGWDEVETELAVSFCALTIETPGMMCVPDASKDERFKDNRLVVGPPNVRFYLGVPIVTPDGYNIGAVCAVDSVPRDFEPHQYEALKLLSKMTIERLEERQRGREREEAFRYSVERAVDGIAVVEADGSVLLANPALAELVGESRLEGTSIWDHISVPGSGLAEHLVDLAATGATDASIQTIVAKGSVPIQVAAVPLEFRGQTCVQLTVRDISQQVELARSEHSAWILFQGFIDQIPAIAYVKDRHGRHVVVNRHYAEIANRPMRDLIGRRVPDVFPQVASRIEAAEETVLSSGIAHLADEPIPLDDGVHTYRLLVFPLTLASESMVGGVYLDVTAGQTARAELADAEQLFRTVAENLESHVWLSEPDLSVVTYSNRAYERIFGEPVEELYRDPRSYLRWVHPEDRPAVEANHVVGDSHTQIEFRIIRPDGIQRTLRARTISVNDAQGRLRRIAGVTEDITRQRDTAQKLLEAERASSDLIAAFPSGFVALDRAWRYTQVNSVAAEVFGRQAKDLIGKQIWSEFPEFVGQSFYNTYMEVMQEGVPQSFEFHVAPWNRWFENRVVPMSDGICIFFSETTDRHGLQERVESQSRYLEHANLLVLSASSLKVRVWNDEAENLYGFGREEALGREVDDLLRTRFEVPPDAVRHHLELHGRWEGQIERRRKDGSELVLNNRRTLLQEEDGTPIAVVEVSNDITELTRMARERDALRSQVSQAERLDALGQLAGGIAHDFNNLLAVVLANLGFALDDEAVPPRMHADLEEARRAAERASALTHQLLLFARQGQTAYRPLDLNAIVTDMSSMLRRLIGDHITLETALERDLPAILADPVRVEQIIANLVVNARDAMPEGGSIRIGTARAQAPGDGATPSEHEGVVRLVVADTGRGMTPEVQARAFEPFFTTKSVGQGTGLGLSTVYGAATEAGGTVELRSTVGVGTEVCVTFPVSTLDPVPVVGASGHDARDTRSGRILLVEDEPSVRRVVRRILESDGRSVVEAASVQEAIRLCEGEHGEFALLLTDIALPDGRGDELAARVKDRWPAIRTLFLSGYAADLSAADLPGELIAKPFRSDALLKAVARATRRP